MSIRLPEGDEENVGQVFSEINITPLTDIFLVLLIIFMVGASMAVDAVSGQGASSRLQVELPKGSASDGSASSDDQVVVILPDGRVVLGGEEAKDDELLERLRAAKRNDSSVLIVQADEGVPHGRVVAVMEKAREAGFARVAVATRGD
jgi:biopolymer transport protein ExbD